MRGTQAVLALLVAAAVLAAAAAGAAHAHAFAECARGGGAPGAPMRVLVALRQRNVDKLRQVAAAVSDPRRAEYGRHLSLDEVAALTAPSPRAVAAVEAFFTAVPGAHVDWTVARDFAQVVAPRDALARAFGVRLVDYCHVHSGRAIVRAEHAVPLPHALREHVDLVAGLHDFFETRREKLLAREHVRAATSDAPYLFKIIGGEADLEMYLEPHCQNGQPTLNPAALCADAGTPIDHFSIFVEPDMAVAQELRISAKKARCVLDGKRTVCVVSAYVSPFARCAVNATTVFADGSSSATYTFPTRYAPTAYVTPQAVFGTYGVPAGFRATNAKSTQAVVSFEEQYISYDDLQQFFDLSGLQAGVPRIVGPNDPSAPGGESTLDVQYVMGVGRGVDTTVWSYPQGDYILNWAMTIANTSYPPFVTSISYGDTESGYLEKSGYGLAYIQRMEDELAEMAARGLTVIAGSGDAGWSNVGEMGNDLSQPDPTCTPGRAFYPSSSHYVLSLSSTFLARNYVPACDSVLSAVPGSAGSAVPIQCQRVAEIAVSVTEGRSWTTGGGFANLTMRPSWQDKLVTEFIATSPSLPPVEFWNPNGRGYADISTLGWNELIVWNGVMFAVGGTSASGPVMAGLIALLNDIRFNNNLGPLGFVNPLFYSWAESHPEAFNDVTVGTNNDGDIQPPGSPYPTFCKFGFAAQQGWDPVTGLGTPNWAEMRQLVLRA